MAIFHVNVAAPYLLTAHIHRPRRTTSGWATARRNGWPPAMTRRPWPAAATGTTSTGKSRITPSAMSGSRTNSWTTWPA